MAQASADVRGTEDRRLLDHPLRELEKMCQEPCRNPRCKKRKEFQGVTDNARVKCKLRFHSKNQDLSDVRTADHFNGWSEGVTAAVRATHNIFPQTWADCSPRFVFHTNEALKAHDEEEVPLTIRVLCKKCNEELANINVEHTVENLYLDLRKYLVHDPSLPLWYSPGSANENLPDDARAVCELSHRPAMNDFVQRILPEHIEAITASLERGALHTKLQEKRAAATANYRDPAKSYLRIGLGLEALGKFTAVLELWPLGHQSPKHAHGGCAGSVRVVYGALLCNLYESLLDEEPMRNLKMEAGRTTWLNRQNNFVHEVRCDPSAGLPFAMSVHLYKSCTDAFAFVNPEAREAGEGPYRKIEKGNPSNDYFWNLSNNLGLPDMDPRVKEVREGVVKDFVVDVLKDKALAEGTEGAVSEAAATVTEKAKDDGHEDEGGHEQVLQGSLWCRRFFLLALAITCLTFLAPGQVQMDGRDWNNLGNAGGGEVQGVSYTQAQCYLRAVQIDANYAPAWNNLGVEGGGQVQGVSYTEKQCYLRALEIDAKYAPAWNNLGVEGGGQVQGVSYTAAQCYLRALEIDAKNAPAWHSLGRIGGGQVQGVTYTQKQCYEKSLELDLNPKFHPFVWRNLASIGGGTVAGVAYTAAECERRAQELQ